VPTWPYDPGAGCGPARLRRQRGIGRPGHERSG